MGSSSSWIHGIRAPDLLTWSQRPPHWALLWRRDGCGADWPACPTVDGSRLQAPLSPLISSGLQPGPSDSSCCLRPSRCVFRDGLPHTLVHGLPSGLAVLVPPLIPTRPL